MNTSKYSGVLWLFVSAWLPGCVDTTPLDYSPARRDAAADAPAVDPGVIATCRECVTGEGAPCRSDYDNCAKVETCPELLECLLSDGCFSLRALEDRIACGEPCFDEFGINAGTHPALQAALPMNVCTQGVCQDACLVEE